MNQPKRLLLLLVFFGTVFTSAAEAVAKTPQTIDGPNFSSPRVVSGDLFSVSATATSGLAVSFATSTPKVCSISGATLTAQQFGTCTVTVTQPGNEVYASAKKSASITIDKVGQSLSFNALPALVYGASGTLSAVASSGLPVKITSTTTKVCLVNGMTVKAIAAGNCIVAANQAGNAQFDKAAQITQSIAVAKAEQTLSFAAAPTLVYGDRAKLAVSASSQLAVSLSSATPDVCKLSGTTLTAIAAGDCRINADQKGDAHFNPAPQATLSLSIAKANQSLRFGKAPTLVTAAIGQLSATTTSDLAVSFASATPEICSVINSKVTALAAGACIVTADQAGNLNFSAAAQQQQTIPIAKSKQTIAVSFAPKVVYTSQTASVSAAASSGLPVDLSVTTPNVCNLNGTTLSGLKAGICKLAASQSGNENYLPVASSPSVTVAVPPPLANAGASQTGVVGTLVKLDGSASRGKPLSYHWILIPPKSSTAVLKDLNSVSPSFIPDMPGLYQGRLVVSNGQTYSAPSSVNIQVASSGLVSVNVKASDPKGLTLHYQWKVSEGSIMNVDKPSTTWTLPPGPGVHFANVLISNNQGGYAARRIAVITDDFGISPPVTSPQDFQPTTIAGKNFAYSSIFKVADATDAADSILLTRFVYLPDFAVTDPTLDGLPSDTQGRLVENQLEMLDHGADLSDPYSSTTTHPHTHVNVADYIVGSVRLADGSLCGIDDKFHGVNVAATASAVDANLNPLPLAKPVQVYANAYGDYALPWQAEAVQVRIDCESAAPVYVKINAQTRIADKAILPSKQPLISPNASSMTAKEGTRSIGIFLPPELNQPSDNHPSGEKFLGFKGMDTQQEACQYYKSTGAVKDCDAQGNPSGAITFDDWKRKTQMAPYLQPEAKEVDATYINRIDLNLTRRHHSISYADQPGGALISAGDLNNCVVRTDNTLACWGSNRSGQSSPPAGKFIQVSATADSTCGIKVDGTLACWGDNYFGQTSPPEGRFKQLSSAVGYSCAINSNDALICWGNVNQTTIPTGSFSEVSAGGQHACAIRINGTLVCWGDIEQSTIPGGSFIHVSAKGFHTCAIRTDETLTCWGNVDKTTLVDTQIRDPFFTCGHKPDGNWGCGVDIPAPAGNFRQVSSGDEYSCGLKTDDTLVCWGDNSYGQTSVPIGSFSQVSAGADHACAIKLDGEIVCWGDNHDGQVSAPDFKHHVAAYVCNHLGPKTNSQKDIDAAIDNAVKERNLVACVAMDYQTHHEGETPYVRYYVFTANGQLSLSINLDGRQEKYVPGTCAACHGGDKYDGHFPTDNGSPDFGGHFLPYDVGNFLFSSKPGLTKAEQQGAIHQLNNIVLQTHPTQVEKALINAWYKAGTDILDEDYWPDDWKAAAIAKPKVDIEHIYKDVNARYCRTCHVVVNREGMGSGASVFDNPEFFERWTEDVDPSATPLTVCGNSPFLHDNHTMPNSLVTFNLMWNDKHAIGLIRQLLGKNCADKTPDPELARRP